jgi:hypothetical protein
MKHSLLIISLSIHVVAILIGSQIIYNLIKELYIGLLLGMRFENNDTVTTQVVLRGVLFFTTYLFYIMAYYFLLRKIPLTFPKKSLYIGIFLYIAIGMLLVKLITFTTISVTTYNTSLSIWDFLVIYSLFFVSLIIVVIHGLKMRNYILLKKKRE